MSEKRTAPLNSREFLLSARDLVGETYLVNLYNIGPRSIRRWVAQRPYVDEDSIRENPVEKFESLLEKLMTTPGGADVAKAIVARHCNLVGCDLDETATCTIPDKPTIEAECLDDYPALVNFHRAIQDERTPDMVRFYHREARRELDETLAAYLRPDWASQR